MDHRSALIGAASVAGVVVAGILAIGASVGLLHGSDSGAIGQLAANDVTSTREIVDVAGRSTGGAQEFLVQPAGSIVLAVPDGELRLVDVRLNPGWLWRERATSPAELHVDLTDGRQVYEFTALLSGSGDIVASFDETTGVSAASQRTTSDDHSENLEHEGRDDDD